MQRRDPVALVALLFAVVAVVVTVARPEWLDPYRAGVIWFCVAVMVLCALILAYDFIGALVRKRRERTAASDKAYLDYVSRARDQLERSDDRAALREHAKALTGDGVVIGRMTPEAVARAGQTPGVPYNVSPFVSAASQSTTPTFSPMESVARVVGELNLVMALSAGIRDGWALQRTVDKLTPQDLADPDDDTLSQVARWRFKARDLLARRWQHRVEPFMALEWEKDGKPNLRPSLAYLADFEAKLDEKRRRLSGHQETESAEDSGPPTPDELAPYRQARAVRGLIGPGKVAINYPDEHASWKDEAWHALPEEDRERVESLPMLNAIAYVMHVANRLEREHGISERVALLKRMLALAEELDLRLPRKAGENSRTYWDAVLWVDNVRAVLPEEWEEGFYAAAYTDATCPRDEVLYLDGAVDWLKRSLPKLEAAARRKDSERAE